MKSDPSVQKLGSRLVFDVIDIEYGRDDLAAFRTLLVDSHGKGPGKIEIVNFDAVSAAYDHLLARSTT